MCIMIFVIRIADKHILREIHLRFHGIYSFVSCVRLYYHGLLKFSCPSGIPAVFVIDHQGPTERSLLAYRQNFCLTLHVCCYQLRLVFSFAFIESMLSVSFSVSRSCYITC